MRHSADRWAALTLVLLLPLVTMAVLPFADTSEPRYAEIARLMMQTGDWITPWFRPGIPFWGKPPLSFWAQAGSMMLLGPNEFAARFPSWLCTMATTWILFLGLRKLSGMAVALSTVIIYNSCALAYIASGAVLTDAFLALGTTLSMVSFALVIDKTPDNALWKYGFFVGIAIGLMAKGPLAAVLVLAPILLWSICKRRTRLMFNRLPWINGSLLVAALCLPWYVLAEIKTPGFLDYFIIGEHVRRFLDAGWQGDLYGTAHQEPRGMIWAYWLFATFPWGVAVLATLLCTRYSPRIRLAYKTVAAEPMCGYWLAWAVFTPMFFSLSANILWTYLLPALAGFSILAALLLEALRTQPTFRLRHCLLLAGIVPLGVLALTLAVFINPDIRSSERSLIRYVAQPTREGVPLFYLGDLPFSARFYSGGEAGRLNSADLHRMQSTGVPFYLAIPKAEQAKVARTLGLPLDKLFQNRRYVLIKLSPAGVNTGLSPAATGQKRVKG